MFRRNSTGRRDRRGDSVAAIANRFSGGGFTPLTLADEIDGAMENLRLKWLTKVTVGPLISDVFSKVEDPLMEVVRQADDLEEAWAIRWTVDTLISAGTKMVGGGFFAPHGRRKPFMSRWMTRTARSAASPSSVTIWRCRMACSSGSPSAVPSILPCDPPASMCSRQTTV